MPRLTMSVRYTIKDRPKATPGYAGCNMAYGRDKAVPLARMAYAVLVDIIEHYAQFESVEVINSELDALRETLADVSIKSGPVTQDILIPSED